MSRDLTLYRTLINLVSVLDQSEAQNNGNDTLASFTDPAAIRQARVLALKGIEALLNVQGEPAASESRSSVAIEMLAKGAPKITVKAYTGSPVEPALIEATEAWRRLVSDLVTDAKVKESEVAHA